MSRIILGIGLLIITSSLACAAPYEPASSGAPSVDISQLDSPADQTLVRILIQNAGMGCATIYIDRVITSRPVPHRPVTVMNFQLVNGSGQIVRPKATLTGTFMGARPQDVIRLDCGMVVGRIVDLQSAMWFGDLPAGTYRLRATFITRPRSFAESTKGWLAGLSELTSERESELLRRLRDHVLETNEIELSVK